jgi:hypothetical protein
MTTSASSLLGGIPKRARHRTPPVQASRVHSESERRTLRARFHRRIPFWTDRGGRVLLTVLLQGIL